MGVSIRNVEAVHKYVSSGTDSPISFLRVLLQSCQYGIEWEDNRSISNWKETAVTYTTYYWDICMEDLSKTTKTLIRIPNIMTEFWNENFPNMCLERYSYANPFDLLTSNTKYSSDYRIFSRTLISA
jgi:hypothetical protein